MYLKFYGLREEPFGVTPDPRFLFASPTYQEAQATLEYGIRSGRGFTALIAKPGMGKTTLLFHLLERYAARARTAFIFLTQCDSREFLRYLMSELGTDTRETDFVRLQEQFGQLLAGEAQAGRKVIAVVDEAQNLDVSVLETVRLLSDFETPRAKLLHIILAGQPELADRLASPALLQLRQRISHLVRLEPLSAAEVNRYIEHRLRMAGYGGGPLFTPQALALIVERSGGVPRIINNLCFNALSLSFATGQRSIGAEIVKEVSADLDFEAIIRGRKEERAAAARLEAARAEPLGGAALPESEAWPAVPVAEAEGTTEFAPPEVEAPIMPAAPVVEIAAAASAASAQGEPATTLPGPVLVSDLPNMAAASRPAEEAAEVGNLALHIVPAEAATPGNGSADDAEVIANRSNGGAPQAAAAEPGKVVVDVEALASDCALFGMEEPRRWKRPTGRVPAVGRTATAPLKSAAARPGVARPGATALPSAGNGAGPRPAANGNPGRAPAAAAIGKPVNQVAAKPGAGANLWPLHPTGGMEAGRKRRQRSVYVAGGASLLLLLLLFWLLGSSPSAAPAQSGAETSAATPSAPAGAVATASSSGTAATSDSSVLDVVEELPRPGEQGDTPPAVVMRGTRSGEELVRRLDPVYPAAARANHIQGPVVLEATIGTHGFLRHIRVLSGDPLLADSVLDAVRGWRYRPRTVRGRAVESETRIVVNFELVAREAAKRQ